MCSLASGATGGYPGPSAPGSSSPRPRRCGAGGRPSGTRARAGWGARRDHEGGAE
ncbi:protein arginine methyltransferase 3 [Homo sapiens]|uniref:Protein arginine methyltransferase 3 n=1 Tax=Homo sapiens TaxID=9606 RepID=E9PRB4_HUMAN|nr:protein arginine methyltransferase 3 [Homo sapiens]KAI4070445.1 protein arginine methyltransferase 3 [Homo sapiens]